LQHRVKNTPRKPRNTALETKTKQNKTKKEKTSFGRGVSRKDQKVPGPTMDQLSIIAVSKAS